VGLHGSVTSSVSDTVPSNSESPVDPADTQLGHYLIATWAKVCQAMGSDFEPYLPVVMPALLTTASAKADISVYGTLPQSQARLPPLIHE
jgi:hypothetical protein